MSQRCWSRILSKVVLMNSIWIANGKKMLKGGLKEFAIMSDSEDEDEEVVNEERPEKYD